MTAGAAAAGEDPAGAMRRSPALLGLFAADGLALPNHSITRMARPKRKAWTPAAEFKVTKLKPNGPKPGQSVDAFIYGKDKGYQDLIDNPKTKLRDVA